MGDLVARATALIATAGSLRDPKSLFALLCVTIFVVYGLSVGRTKALVSLLSIYVAYVLTILFPFSTLLAARIPERYDAFALLGLFFALYAVAFMLISHSMRKTRLTLGDISFFHVLLITVVQVGLLASISLSLVSEQMSQGLLGPLTKFFLGTRPLWLWAAASLAILPLMKSRSRE